MFKYTVLHCLTACKLKPLSGKNKIYTIYDKNSVDTRGGAKRSCLVRGAKEAGGCSKKLRFCQVLRYFIKLVFTSTLVINCYLYNYSTPDDPAGLRFGSFAKVNMLLI